MEKLNDFSVVFSEIKEIAKVESEVLQKKAFKEGWEWLASKQNLVNF